jgi:hypothetical protein
MLENIKKPHTLDMQCPGLPHITLCHSFFAMFRTEIGLDKWIHTLRNKHVCLYCLFQRCIYYRSTLWNFPPHPLMPPYSAVRYRDSCSFTCFYVFWEAAETFNVPCLSKINVPLHYISHYFPTTFPLFSAWEPN